MGQTHLRTQPSYTASANLGPVLLKPQEGCRARRSFGLQPGCRADALADPALPHCECKPWVVAQNCDEANGPPQVSAAQVQGLHSQCGRAGSASASAPQSWAVAQNSDEANGPPEVPATQVWVRKCVCPQKSWVEAQDFEEANGPLQVLPAQVQGLHSQCGRAGSASASALQPWVVAQNSDGPDSPPEVSAAQVQGLNSQRICPKTFGCRPSSGSSNTGPRFALAAAGERVCSTTLG